MPNGSIAGAKRMIGQLVVAVVRDKCSSMDIIHFASDVTNHRLRLECQTRRVFGRYFDLEAMIKKFATEDTDKKNVKNRMTDRFWYFVCQCAYGDKAWKTAVSSPDELCKEGNLFKKHRHRWVLNEDFFGRKNLVPDAFVKFFEKCVASPEETFSSCLKVMGWTEALWIYDMPKDEKSGHVAFDNFKNLLERRSKKRKGGGEEARAIARDKAEVKRLRERFNSQEVWK